MCVRFQIGKTRVHITFFFAAGFAFLAMQKGSVPTLCILSAVLLHECTHFVCLRLCRVQPQTLIVGLFGMRLSDECMRLMHYKRELFCILSAPLLNLLSAVFCLPFLQKGEIVQTLFAVHFSLGFFNLLPLRCLDGGRGLLCLLYLFLPPIKAEKYMTAIEWIFFLLFVLFLGGYFFTVRFEPTALVFLFYLAFLLFFRK